MVRRSRNSKSKADLSETKMEAIKENGFVTFLYAMVTLSIARYASVNALLIDKCNGSFEPWEEFQRQLLNTWRTSFQFVPGLFIWLEKEKLGVLYGVRLSLGIFSVLTEATLVVALFRKYGMHISYYTLAMLCFSSGCFFASTSFLPSSFSMYALSLSSAFYLLDMPTVALAVAAIGTTLGWSFLVLTFLPVIVHSLFRNQEHAFLRWFIVTSVVTVLSISLSHQFYELCTSADLFFYNMVEGGVDGSYAIEGLLYYLKNGFGNFSFGYVFALLFLIILPIVREKYVPEMLVVISPVYILTAFMSLQPHMEERFLYSIYPLVCVAASTVINSFPDLVRHKFTLNDNSLLVMIAKYARPSILGVILYSSYFHTSHLTNGYSALEICKLGN